MDEVKFPEKSVLKGVTDFSVELLKNKLDAHDNVVISPVSLMAVLAMAMRGAKENTLREMAAAIGADADALGGYLERFFDSEAAFEPVRTQETENKPVRHKFNLPKPAASAIADMIRSLGENNINLMPHRKASNTEPLDVPNPLKFANSVWVKEDAKVDFNKDFFDKCAESDYAEIFKAPFNDETCSRINKWVSEHTDNEIQKIVDSFKEDDILYLINALLFDAKWAKRYDKDKICDHVFENYDGRSVLARFMEGNEEKFLRDTDATGFIKGYQGGRYEFIALLPNRGIELSEYVSGLTGDRLLKIIDHYEDHPVETLMPKFEVQYSVEFKPVLQKMGIVDAFDKFRADFTGIGKATEPEHNICIGDIKQISKIKVDENGTKAVAVTSASMNCMVLCMPPIPYRVYLDRPFLYVIFDKITRMPVFMGMVNSMPKNKKQALL